MLRRLLLWGPVLVYMAAIFHFSSQSDPLPAVTAVVWDKALHLTEYAGLGLLLCRALRGEGLGWLQAAALAVAVSSAYGATDEWHQAYVPFRTADRVDWMADTTGGLVGVAGFSMASHLRRRLRR